MQTVHSILRVETAYNVRPVEAAYVETAYNVRPATTCPLAHLPIGNKQWHLPTCRWPLATLIASSKYPQPATGLALRDVHLYVKYSSF